jgi:broad specificity phosphatase PhoE
MKRIFAFVRHGNTLPKAEGADDNTRRLSPDGVKQSQMGGKLLAQRIDSFNLVLASSAVRCGETASHVLEMFPAAPKPQALVQLYPVGNDEIDKMFNHLQYSPTSTYREHYFTTGEYATLENWSTIANDAIMSVCETLPEDKDANILIVAHAVCIPMIIASMLHGIRGVDTSEWHGLIENINMGEADSLIVTQTIDDDGNVTDVMVEHIVNPLSKRPVGYVAEPKTEAMAPAK